MTAVPPGHAMNCGPRIGDALGTHNHGMNAKKRRLVEARDQKAFWDEIRAEVRREQEEQQKK
jgi:hypothetical protein